MIIMEMQYITVLWEGNLTEECFCCHMSVSKRNIKKWLTNFLTCYRMTSVEGDGGSAPVKQIKNFISDKAMAS